MKFFIKSLIILGLLSSYLSADCATLAKKYKAPDPASKTMKQVKRWVKRKVKNASEASELEKCLVAAAADNPNKSKMAGQ